MRSPVTFTTRGYPCLEFWSARMLGFCLALCLGVWFVLFAVQPVYAWSAKGHAAIAQQAFAYLPSEQQQFFNRDAAAFLNNDKAQKWRRTLTGYSPFAQAAVWPDTQRKKTLHTVFNRYAKQPVPAALQRFKPYNTAKWHYVNAQYWDVSRQALVLAGAKSRCKTRVNGQLAIIWPVLLSAYQQFSLPKKISLYQPANMEPHRNVPHKHSSLTPKASAERGLVLAFISHLLADAYQPLHGLAALNQQCRHDAGGNGHCLVYKNSGRCRFSLHRLWDRGFDVFKHPYKTSVEKAQQGPPLAGAHPSSLYVAKDMVNQALSGHKPLADFIYSVPQGQMPSAAYKQQAQRITANNAEAAARQLGALMGLLYAELHD